MKNTINWVLITFSLMIISKLVDHLTGFNLPHLFKCVGTLDYVVSDPALHWDWVYLSNRGKGKQGD